jgi:tetratricopeptide (TPR) repeat protein
MGVQDLPPNPETDAEPEDLTVRRLVRALDYAEGFWLGFAKSNTPAQRRRLAALCRDLLEPLKIRVLEIELNEPVSDLLPVLRERLAKEAAANDEKKTQPKLAVFVHGLERSIPSREAYPPLLSALNLKRELFRQEVPHPLLLWLPDYALTALARKAPDFWAWRSGLYEFAPERDAAEQSLKVLRGEAPYVVQSSAEHVKRERLFMLKGLLEDYLELGDSHRERGAQANILNEMGLVHDSLSEWAEAERAYEQSLAMFRSLEADESIANVLHNLAMVTYERGEVGKARQFYNESLEINKRGGNQNSAAVTLHELGRIAHEQGETEEARRLYDESLELTGQHNAQSSGAAVTLHQLALLAQQQGNIEEARRLYGESLGIDKRIGNQNGIAVSLHNLAALAQGQGDVEEARRLYGESLEIVKSLGNPNSVAITLYQLGTLASSEGDKAEAARLFSEALDIFESLGSPKAEHARRRLAQVKGRAGVSD